MSGLPVHDANGQQILVLPLDFSAEQVQALFGLAGMRLRCDLQGELVLEPARKPAHG